MLIQAYCQQEREKRCTITAQAAEPNPQEIEESSDEKMDTDEIDTDQTTDGTKTPKIEPNISPTPNDVEMIDTTEPVTAIKQEPEDEVTSIEMDPLADGDGNDGGGSRSGSGGGDDSGNTGDDENSTSAIKSDTKNDSQQSESQSIKIESDENCNDCSDENDKDQNPSESTTTTTAAITTTDESIKIEESTVDKDDPYSKDINIDPRTYCKLGHFHLLLEDYAKGMN